LTSFFNKDNVNVDGATESTVNNSAPIQNEVSQPNQSANAETTENSKQNDNAHIKLSDWVRSENALREHYKQLFNCEYIKIVGAPQKKPTPIGGFGAFESRSKSTPCGFGGFSSCTK
jgi:hypothetical protein